MCINATGRFFFCLEFTHTPTLTHTPLHSSFCYPNVPRCSVPSCAVYLIARLLTLVMAGLMIAFRPQAPNFRFCEPTGLVLLHDNSEYGAISGMIACGRSLQLLPSWGPSRSAHLCSLFFAVSFPWLGCCQLTPRPFFGHGSLGLRFPGKKEEKKKKKRRKEKRRFLVRLCLDPMRKMRVKYYQMDAAFVECEFSEVPSLHLVAMRIWPCLLLFISAGLGEHFILLWLSA